MIILRQKEFRRDPMPDPKFLYDLNIEEEFGVEIEYEIQETKQYNADLELLSPTDRKKVKALRKDIKAGYLYEDGDAGGDTHHLSSYSHFTGENKSHFMSKAINSNDRLNYRVYEPKLIKQEDGSYRYIQKITLSTCKGHKINGGGKY